MKLIVNAHKIELVQDQAVNEKEIDISKCEFEFADEITNDYVKEAYFTLGDKTYKQVITNNQCSIPQEVLVRPATIELGVVAYLVENESEIKRYNPTPVYFKTDLGSLKTAQNSQPITPSEMEQYEQALEDGLNEVANVDIDASKTGNTATITITDRTGTQKSVQVKDGDKGDKGDPGATGQTGATGPAGKDGADGKDGKDGADGYSPSASVSKSGSTATITITDKSGTTTTTISDGVNGTNGQDGRDGYVQYTAGDNITIENNVISASGGATTTIVLDYSSVINYDVTTWGADRRTQISNQTIKDTTVAEITKYGYENVNILLKTSTSSYVASGNIFLTYATKSGTKYIYEGMVPRRSGSGYNVMIWLWVDSDTSNNFIFDNFMTMSVPSYDQVLTKDNTTSYTPSGQYNPATKGYVDSAITTAITTTLGGSY